MQAYAVSMWSELSSCPDACVSLRIASARCMIATTPCPDLWRCSVQVVFHT
jgi:hypothetical protein